MVLGYVKQQKKEEERMEEEDVIIKQQYVRSDGGESTERQSVTVERKWLNPAGTGQVAASFSQVINVQYHDLLLFIPLYKHPSAEH